MPWCDTEEDRLRRKAAKAHGTSCKARHHPVYLKNTELFILCYFNP